MDLEKEVATFIRANDLVSERDSIVVGVSGGPDSVALLHLLCSLNAKKSLGCRFYIAHLNHKLRGMDSEEDAGFIRRLSNEFNLPVFIKEIDIKGVAMGSRCSIEEAGRRERYKFFRDYSQEVGASRIAVGHSADDNVETLLQRIIRGTGILGLCGMRPKRPISPDSNILLIRPLLHSWKKEIIRYLEERDIPYRIDSSNLQEVHLRNKIRIELLPLIQKGYNNQIKRVLLNLCEILNENYDFIDTASLSLLKDVILEESGSRYILGRNILLSFHPIIQYKIIHNILTRMEVPLKDFSYHHYKDILRHLKAGEPKKILRLPSNLMVWIEDARLFFQSQAGLAQGIRYEDEQSGKTGGFTKVELNLPGATPLPFANATIEAEIIDNEEGFLERFEASKTPYEEVIDMGKVTLPLSVRFRRPGDRFWPLGASGTKKLKDFLIDKKVPRFERDKLPIVTSADDEPIWIIGLRIDHRVRVSKETRKVIKLKYIVTI